MENDKDQKLNPSLTDGITPANLSASLDKEHNSAEPLHTPQTNRKEIKEISGGTAEETPYSNSNVQNYLGSEKLDEKLATQTEKFQDDMRKSENNKDKNNKIKETPDVL
jgi:hypothetical protein